MLDQLTKKHKIELSVIKTGHDQFTSGGSVSNHFVGRGIDIARVDGEIVNPGSAAARELATEIAAITGDLRPTEVGTPWSIARRGLLHRRRPPGPPARGLRRRAARRRSSRPRRRPPAAAPAAAVASAAPGQPAAAAAAPRRSRKIGDSMSFRAVTAEDAAADAKPKKGDSMSFMAVQPPAGPASAVAAPGTVPAAVADAATATASGSSSLGASALEVAKGELAKGVKEEGVNTGTDVDKYLARPGSRPATRGARAS